MPDAVNPDEWDRTKAAYWAKMSRADRLSNGRFLPGSTVVDTMKCNDGEEHRWQPLSFRFESQLLDNAGRVQIRQPDMKQAHIYVLCMGCRTWTYVVAEWAGYYLGGPGQGFAGPDPVLSMFDTDDEDDEEEPAQPTTQES